MTRLRGGSGAASAGAEHGRASTFVLIGVLVFLVGLGTAAASVVWLDTRVSRVEVEGIAPQGDLDGDGEVDVEEITDVLNVLLVGSDSRENLTEEERRELSTGGTDVAEGVRTDTIMLLRLDPQAEQVGLLSFPRDLLVTRCDGSRGRINAAYGIGDRTGVGGASCLVQTINDFTGVPVHHYVEVDFSGFIEVVDTLGGVTMGLDEPLYDRRAGLDLPAGCVTLTAADALAFVRARHLDNDFGRIARQQRFIKELTAEVTSTGTLLNVPRLFSLVDTAGRAVETDRGLSLRQMRRIAFTLRDLTDDDLAARTVPGEFERSSEGMVFLVPDEELAGAMFTAFREGTLFGAPPQEDDDADEDAAGDPDATEEATAVPDVDPADVGPVDVLNGAGISGLATRATAALQDEGFTIGEVGNAPAFDDETTVVRYPAGQREAAEAVAARFPGAEVRAGGVERITVEVGADFAEAAEDDGTDGEAGQGSTEEPAMDPALLDPTEEPEYAGASTTLDC